MKLYAICRRFVQAAPWLLEFVWQFDSWSMRFSITLASRWWQTNIHGEGLPLIIRILVT